MRQQLDDLARELEVRPCQPLGIEQIHFSMMRFHFFVRSNEDIFKEKINLGLFVGVPLNIHPKRRKK